MFGRALVDLENPLARDHKLAADFLGGAAAPVHEAETQLEAGLPDGRPASCALLTGPTALRALCVCAARRAFRDSCYMPFARCIPGC